MPSPLVSCMKAAFTFVIEFTLTVVAVAFGIAGYVINPYRYLANARSLHYIVQEEKGLREFRYYCFWMVPMGVVDTLCMCVFFVIGIISWRGPRLYRKVTSTSGQHETRLLCVPASVAKYQPARRKYAALAFFTALTDLFFVACALVAALFVWTLPMQLRYYRMPYRSKQRKPGYEHVYSYRATNWRYVPLSGILRGMVDVIVFVPFLFVNVAWRGPKARSKVATVFNAYSNSWTSLSEGHEAERVSVNSIKHTDLRFIWRMQQIAVVQFFKVLLDIIPVMCYALCAVCFPWRLESINYTRKRRAAMYAHNGTRSGPHWRIVGPANVALGLIDVLIVALCLVPVLLAPWRWPHIVMDLRACHLEAREAVKLYWALLRRDGQLSTLEGLWYESNCKYEALQREEHKAATGELQEEWSVLQVQLESWKKEQERLRRVAAGAAPEEEEEEARGESTDGTSTPPPDAGEGGFGAVLRAGATMLSALARAAADADNQPRQQRGNCRTKSRRTPSPVPALASAAARIIAAATPSFTAPFPLTVEKQANSYKLQLAQTVATRKAGKYWWSTAARGLVIRHAFSGLCDIVCIVLCVVMLAIPLRLPFFVRRLRVTATSKDKKGHNTRGWYYCSFYMDIIVEFGKTVAMVVSVPSLILLAVTVYRIPIVVTQIRRVRAKFIDRAKKSESTVARKGQLEVVTTVPCSPGVDNSRSAAYAAGPSTVITGENGPNSDANNEPVTNPPAANQQSNPADRAPDTPPPDSIVFPATTPSRADAEVPDQKVRLEGTTRRYDQKVRLEEDSKRPAELIEADDKTFRAQLSRIVVNSLLVIADLLCVVPAVVVFLTGFRARKLWHTGRFRYMRVGTEEKKEENYWSREQKWPEKPAQKRGRHLTICGNFFLLLRDIPCIAVSLLLFYRLPGFVSRLRMLTSNRADPTPLVHVSSVIPEFTPGRGWVLHVQGTKPAELEVKTATLHIRGKDFWHSFRNRYGAGLYSLASLYLPVEAMPRFMSAADFAAGKTELSFSIHPQIKVKRSTIIKKLKLLDVNAPLEVAVECFSGRSTLFAFETTVNELLYCEERQAAIPLRLPGSVAATEPHDNATANNASSNGGAAAAGNAGRGLAIVPEGRGPAVVSSDNTVVKKGREGKWLCDVYWKEALATLAQLIFDLFALLLWLITMIFPPRFFIAGWKAFRSSYADDARRFELTMEDFCEAVGGMEEAADGYLVSAAVTQKSCMSVDQAIGTIFFAQNWSMYYYMRGLGNADRVDGSLWRRRGKSRRNLWNGRYGSVEWTVAAVDDTLATVLADMQLLRVPPEKADAMSEAVQLVRNTRIHFLTHLNGVIQSLDATETSKRSHNAQRSVAFCSYADFLAGRERMAKANAVRTATTATTPGTTGPMGSTNSQAPMTPVDASSVQERAMSVSDQITGGLCCGDITSSDFNWTQARQTLCKQHVQLYVDLLAIICGIIVLATVYRAPMFIWHLTKYKRERRMLCFYHATQIPLDVLHIFLFALVVATLKHSVSMIAAIVDGLIHTGFGRVRKTIRRYVRYFFSDLWELLSLFMLWRTYKWSIATAAFGLLAPAELFSGLFVTSSKKLQVVIILVAVVVCYGYPFVLRYWLAPAGNCADGSLAFVAILLFLMLVAMISVLYRRRKARNRGGAQLSHPQPAAPSGQPNQGPGPATGVPFASPNSFVLTEESDQTNSDHAGIFYKFPAVFDTVPLSSQHLLVGLTLLLEVLQLGALALEHGSAPTRAAGQMAESTVLSTTSRNLLLLFNGSSHDAVFFGYYFSIAMVALSVIVFSLPLVVHELLGHPSAALHTKALWHVTVFILGEVLCLTVSRNLFSFPTCLASQPWAEHSTNSQRKLLLVGLLCLVYYVPTVVLYRSRYPPIVDSIVLKYSGVYSCGVAMMHVVLAAVSARLVAAEVPLADRFPFFIVGALLCLAAAVIGFKQLGASQPLASTRSLAVWRSAAHLAGAWAFITAAVASKQSWTIVPVIVLLVGWFLVIVAGCCTRVWLTRLVRRSAALGGTLVTDMDAARRLLRQIASTLSNEATQPSPESSPAAAANTLGGYAPLLNWTPSAAKQFEQLVARATSLRAFHAAVCFISFRIHPAAHYPVFLQTYTSWKQRLDSLVAGPTACFTEATVAEALAVAQALYNGIRGMPTD